MTQSDFLSAFSNLAFPFGPWVFSHLCSEDICGPRPLEPVIAGGGRICTANDGSSLSHHQHFLYSMQVTTTRPCHAITCDYWKRCVGGREAEIEGIRDEDEGLLCFYFTQVTLFQIKQCRGYSPILKCRKGLHSTEKVTS